MLIASKKCDPFHDPRELYIIKEKRCGKIKGRTCADGRSQRSLYSKAETSSPTISNDLTLTLGSDRMDIIQSWIDASFAIHSDMKSHTGGCISFGRGAIMCKSTKQKLNTKSSTEAELVGASDYLPNTIWVKNFLEAQGYEIKENIYHQDNESAIRLKKNGRASSGQKTRHIDIRYFFIKDRVETENITIKHCP